MTSKPQMVSHAHAGGYRIRPYDKPEMGNYPVRADDKHRPLQNG